MSWDEYDQLVPADRIGAEDDLIPTDEPLLRPDAGVDQPADDGGTWVPDSVVEFAEDALGWLGEHVIGTPETPPDGDAPEQ